jgi:hypothetical protein
MIQLKKYNEKLCDDTRKKASNLPSQLAGICRDFLLSLASWQLYHVASVIRICYYYTNWEGIL